MTILRFNGFNNEIKRFDDELNIRFYSASGEEYVVRMDTDLWTDLALALTKRIFRIHQANS